MVKRAATSNFQKSLKRKQSKTYIISNVSSLPNFTDKTLGKGEKLLVYLIVYVTLDLPPTQKNSSKKQPILFVCSTFQHP